jgi:hypothetical protein
MASGSHKTVRVNVLFDGKSAQGIAEHLRSAGLEIEQEFDLLAVISGRIDVEAVSKLQEVEGVLTVEEDREVEALPEEDFDETATDSGSTS